MCAKTRKSERYDVIGKVESDELSAFSGTVLNISSQGCWIHYAAPVTVSLENEYTVKIYLLRRYPLFKRLRFFRIHFWQGNCSSERPRFIEWRGSSSPFFIWSMDLKELSIFIDESGDFGEYSFHSPYSKRRDL